MSLPYVDFEQQRLRTYILGACSKREDITESPDRPWCVLYYPNILLLNDLIDEKKNLMVDSKMPRGPTPYMSYEAVQNYSIPFTAIQSEKKSHGVWSIEYSIYSYYSSTVYCRGSDCSLMLDKGFQRGGGSGVSH